MMTTFPLAQISTELFAMRERLSSVATGSSGAAGVSRFVGRLGNRLQKPPRIVLLGEFNSGKSTLANALIGAELLPTSIHANTRLPLLVHYAERPSLTIESSDGSRRPLDLSAVEALKHGGARLIRVGLPLKRLQSFELIDTPGLAQGSHHLDALCLEACRRSHIAVWCTTATQAWKASEQAMWSSLPCRLRRSSILAVTHKDMIASDRDYERLMQRLSGEASPQFSALVPLAAVEADLASRLPDAPDALARWASSGGIELESRLRSLVEGELSTRQGAAERLLQRAAERLLKPAPSGAVLAT